MKLLTLGIATLLFAHTCTVAREISIIPKPTNVDITNKKTIFSKDTCLSTNNGTKNSEVYLTERLEKGLNIRLASNKNCASTLYLVIDKTYSDNKEAYSLTINKNIEIRSADPAGIFYGVQSFLQLLPADVYSNKKKTNERYELPQLIIKDKPRFPWRGHMIDIARHFFDKNEIMKTIDVMASHKLNVLHLHLSDFNAWRIEVKKYPELINVGAIGDHSNWASGKAHYYLSQNDIKQIVAYAKTRHIMIIPEIDMPGHATAAARSYPEFFDGHATFNPAKEETFEFISNIFDELMPLFPAPYFHIGGDEVANQVRWDSIPEIKAFMKKKGFSLKDLEGYFDNRVVNMILKKGKIPMGWQEIAQFNVDKRTVIQRWQDGFPDAVSTKYALQNNNPMVMSPGHKVYLDYPQQLNEPGWGTVVNSLESIYQWEPIDSSLTPAQAKNIIGVEAPLWTEFVRSNEYRQFMTFPRLAAVAEISWSPKDNKNLAEFKKRMQQQYERYKAHGVNYRAPGTRSGNKYKTN